MDLPTSSQRELVQLSDRARAEELLRSYPNLTDGEVAEFLLFLKNAPGHEMALLTANEQLRPKLFQFRHDHAAEPLSSKEYLIFAVIIIILSVLVSLMWDAGLS